MSDSAHKALPEICLVWPINALDSLVWKPQIRSALVLTVNSLEGFDEQVLKSGLATYLVQNGVELFVLVGSESEQSHDALDWVVEEASVNCVLTSWHDGGDLEDVASFVAVSCSTGSLDRVVVVLDRVTSQGRLLWNHLAEALHSSEEI